MESAVGGAYRAALAGSDDVAAPPVGVEHGSVVVVSFTAILGVGVIGVEFDPGNVPLGEAVFLWGGVTRNAAGDFAPFGLRLVSVLPEGTASVYNLGPEWERVFGTWQVGQKLLLLALPYSVTCRQGGAPQRLSCIVEP